MADGPWNEFQKGTQEGPWTAFQTKPAPDASGGATSAGPWQEFAPSASNEVTPTASTAAGVALQGFTDYPGMLADIGSKNWRDLDEQVNRLFKEPGTWNHLKNAGLTVLEAINYAGSPITAAERSVVSAPIEREVSALRGKPTDIHRTIEGMLDVPIYGVRAAGEALGYIRKAGIAAVNNEYTDPLKALLSPGSMSAEAEHTKVLSVAMMGHLAARQEQAEAVFDAARTYLGKLPRVEKLKFIDRHERGLSHGNAELDKISQAINKAFAERVAQVHAMGQGYLQSVIKDYFPHIWKDPKRASQVMESIYAKAPLEGSKGFLRQRVFQYTSDGLRAGLELADENPINLVLGKIREMDRFILGKTLVDDLKAAGMLKFHPPGKLPAGWKTINDPVARVRLPSKEIKGRFIDMGQYAAPESVARVLNNLLGRSALRDVKAVESLRRAGNALNMTQLGLSGFHLFFVSNDSVVSKVGIAVRQALNLQLADATKSILGVPFAPITSFVKGVKLRNAVLQPHLASPELRQIADAFTMAGGRIRMPRYYAAAEKGALLHGPYVKAYNRAGWKGVGDEIGNVVQTNVREIGESFHNQGLWGGSMDTVGRVAQTTSSWLMEGVVPRMKLGVFYDMAKFELQKNPSMSKADMMRAMQKAWDSVDNRMGELVYDNLTWNKALKDVAHLAVRSVGWNLGTLRELGGGVVDSVKLIDAIVHGNKAEFTHRMAYLVALPITTGMMGAIANKLYTGEWPQETKDYFFPRTGRMTRYGTPERVSLPSYMKDVYEYAHDAGQTLINKTHPLIPMLSQAFITHKDYFDAPIANPEGDWQETLASYIKFFGRSTLPFSVQGIMKQSEEDERTARYLALVGITPAPGYITSPEEIYAAEEKRAVQAYKRAQKYRQ